MTDFHPGVSAVIVSLDDLLTLKRAAGRSQDLLDVDQLESLLRNHGNE